MRANKGGRPLRLLYAAGQGDVVSSFRCWREGKPLEGLAPITYSSLFFSFCEENGFEAHVLSSHERRERIVDGRFVIENRAKPLGKQSRWFWYHLNEVLYGLQLLWLTLVSRTDVVVMVSGTTHWFMALPLRLFGTRVIPVLHNSLWPHGYRPVRWRRRLVQNLNRAFWRHGADVVLANSPESLRQVVETSGGKHGPLIPFLIQMPWDDFLALPAPPDHDSGIFRVLFAGRLERNKGVYDLLQVAEILERERPGRFHFEICGSGPERKGLERAIRERGLKNSVLLWGRLDRRDLLSLYGRSHAVIVPTRSDFCEGLPGVVAEAITATRPVVTSFLSNALDVAGEAIVEAQPNQPVSYAEGLLSLADDAALYQQYREQCLRVRSKFLDLRHGLGAALEQAFRVLDITPSGGTLPGRHTLDPVPAFSVRVPASVPTERLTA